MSKEPRRPTLLACCVPGLSFSSLLQVYLDACLPVPNVCSIVELDQFYNLAIKMLSSLFANVPFGCVELFRISLVSFEL